METAIKTKTKAPKQLLLRLLYIVYACLALKRNNGTGGGGGEQTGTAVGVQAAAVPGPELCESDFGGALVVVDGRYVGKHTFVLR